MTGAGRAGKFFGKGGEAKNPREAAYLAHLAAMREETFVADYLEKWREANSPASLDFSLAREIAFGSVRMALALDHLAEKLAEREKLKLKLREKALLRTAIYQFHYMDRIPLYAIADETVAIAKKYCHETFIRFLNAVLRRLSEGKQELPKEDSLLGLSIRFSYPPYFVKMLIEDFGRDKAMEMMEAQNSSGTTMFRIRPTAGSAILEKDGIELLAGKESAAAVLRDISLLPEIARSRDFYIQNITPIELLFLLAKGQSFPRSVLDLCSSPGGKLLAVHDLYPGAELFANDVSSSKLKPLLENIEKYGIKTSLTCADGRTLKSDRLFDLIILDVPCSNSGVLGKRPEARWRISEKAMDELETMQLDLIKNAASLLAEDGEIWYMTCSILKKENTSLVDKACDLFGLEVRISKTIFPNLEGWDGGFASALKKKS